MVAPLHPAPAPPPPRTVTMRRIGIGVGVIAVLALVVGFAYLLGHTTSQQATVVTPVTPGQSAAERELADIKAKQVAAEAAAAQKAAIDAAVKEALAKQAPQPVPNTGSSAPGSRFTFQVVGGGDGNAVSREMLHADAATACPGGRVVYEPARADAGGHPMTAEQKQRGDKRWHVKCVK